jgi:hypothetical protein
MTGNPQLGLSDLSKPAPYVHYPDGQKQQMFVCPYCKGYFLCMCPCMGWSKDHNCRGMTWNEEKQRYE